MKKFILFIAVITLSFGSVWAENWLTVYNGQSVTPIPYSTVIPFSNSSTSNQHIQLIYPASLFTGINNGDNFDFHSIDGITFHSNNAITLNQNLSFSIKLKAQPNASGYVNITSGSVTNCTTRISGNDLSFEFDAFPYNSTMGDLIVDIQITNNNPTSSQGSDINWEIVENNSYSSIYEINTSVNPVTYTSPQNSCLPKTTFECSRKISDVVYNNAHYNVYTSSRNTSPSAALTQIGTSSDIRYFTYCANSTYTQGVALTLERYNTYKISPNISYAIGTSAATTITITGIEGSPFANLSDENMAIIIPENITYIGTNNIDNHCFDFKLDNSKTYNIAIIINKINNMPDLRGNNLTSMMPMVNSNPVINLYRIQKSTATFNGTNWNSATGSGRIKKLGYVSHPFIVSYYNAYSKLVNQEINDKITENAVDKPLKISSFPFDTHPIKIALTGYPHGNSDGSFHYYNTITGLYRNPMKSQPNYSGQNTTEISTTLSFETEYEVECEDYYAQLNYNQGYPYFNYSSDKSKILGNDESEVNLFKNSHCLLFKLYKTSSGIYNNDSVPHWMYKNPSNQDEYIVSPESLTIHTPIHVEKLLTNDHYRYFSLPFDVPLNAIEVRLLNNGIPGETIPLLETSISSLGDVELQSNYYVIEKYMGQLSSNDGYPEYTQITNSNATQLYKNRGYAFALVEKTVGNNIEAIITFKSHVDGTESSNINNHVYLNTCDDITISTGTSGNLARNQGWNLIGNPFYHYLDANSFYGTSSTAEGDKPIKYITFINDDPSESVTHHYVYEKTTVQIGGSTTSSNLQIKPFQTFFVQTENNGSNITVYPHTATQPYGNGLPAKNDIKEILTVKITDNAGNTDRTTVINDDNRDEHFAFIDDLAKILNPGIQIYTWYDNTPCAFKELPLRADSSMAIPLGVRATEAGNYTFSLDTSLTLFYGAAMLHDKQNNQYYPLNENGVQISLTEGDNNSRFEIVVIPSEIPAELEDVETSETLDAYVHDGRLVVENIAEGSTLSIFDISGKMLYTAPASGDFNYDFYAHGVYMVVLRGNTTGSIKVVY